MKVQLLSESNTLKSVIKFNFRLISNDSGPILRDFIKSLETYRTSSSDQLHHIANINFEINLERLKDELLVNLYFV